MGMEVEIAAGRVIASLVLRRGRPYELWVLARDPVDVLGV